MTTVRQPALTHQPSGARTFVRRLYFYGVSLISLIAIFIGLNTLLRVLDAIWFGSSAEFAIGTFSRDSIAGAGGTLLVATPIFLLHWGRVSQRRDGVEEYSAIRKLFLYLAGAIALGYALFNAYELLYGLALLALGEPVRVSRIWPSGWLHALGMVAIGLGVQAYFLGILRADGDVGREVGWAGTWRRWYQTIAGLVGLGLLIAGGGGLIELLLRYLVDTLSPVASAWLPRQGTATNVALLVLGLALWRLNWVRWHALAAQHPHEAQAALRRFYLYGAAVAGAVVTLTPVAGMIRDVLWVLFSRSDTLWIVLGDQLSTLVGFGAVGLVVWIGHWRYLQREAAAYGESEEGASIRRIYYYAVSAVGLAIMWVGLVEAVLVLLDFMLGRDDWVMTQNLWVEPLASGLSLIAVGAPVWASHWRVAQDIARREDVTGQAERASGVRKVYLYGVALVGAVLILFFLAQFVYRILLMLLGDPSVTLGGAEAAGELARSVIAAIFWTVHVLAIRRDGQLGTDEPETPGLALDERRAILEARIAELELELDRARTELAELPPADGAAAAAEPSS